MNPLRTLQSMRPTLLLMSGRTVGFVVAFAIPMVLARAIDPAQFGTYRLLFLIYGTLVALAQMGMAESLYYFVPQRPAAAGRWVGNAAATLIVIGAVGAVVVTAGASAIGLRFNNALLVRELPKLGVFLALMLASIVLEIVMVCRREYRSAALCYGLSDLARAALLTVPALLAHSIDALMTGAIMFALLRCVAAAAYLRREFGADLRVDRELWRAQLKYALPFAAAVVVELMQVNFHQYAVALWFDPATFAIYSVGCLQIPLVDLLANSAANVMMVSMSDQIARGQCPLALWHETVERLAFVFFPLVIGLMLVARELIVVLFTPAYAAAVPIFMASTAMIALAAFPVDAVLRVYAETRTLLLLNLLRLAFIAAGIGWFVSTFRLPGAVLVTLAAAVLAKAVAMVRIARVMAVPMRRALPWRSLSIAAGAACLAIGPAWLVKTYLAAPGLLLAVVTGVVYGASYLAIMSGGWMLRGILRPAEAPRAA
jgi:O-antigen/teichoic acid export membrane protein